MKCKKRRAEGKTRQWRGRIKAQENGGTAEEDGSSSQEVKLDDRQRPLGGGQERGKRGGRGKGQR